MAPWWSGGSTGSAGPYPPHTHPRAAVGHLPPQPPPPARLPRHRPWKVSAAQTLTGSGSPMVAGHLRRTRRVQGHEVGDVQHAEYGAEQGRDLASDLVVDQAR